MLSTCFLHSPPSSLKRCGAAIRIGSRRRQCRWAVGRHWNGVEELSGGTDGWFTSTATRSSPWSGARSLASQALRHEGTLHAGVGEAVPATVPPEKWDRPSWAGWRTSWYPWTADSAQLTSALLPPLYPHPDFPPFRMYKETYSSSFVKN